jgi:glucosyl-dolichyl phosphate glucuronosyltransferase
MQPSIIIPTFNRCNVLHRTLESVLKLDWSASEREIIVVDNASTDKTRQVVENFNSLHSKHPIRYFYEPVPGLLSGRHRGALEAEGDVCLFLDDDVRLAREWLAAMEESFSDPEVALAGGPSSPLFESDPPQWLASFYRENEMGRFCSWLSLYDSGDLKKEVRPTYIWGLNFAIRKKTLFDLGGFNPDCIPKKLQRFQGDGETGLSLKFEKTGLRCLYNPQAAVQHEIPASRLTADYFSQRAYYQGVADSYTSIRRTGQLKNRDFSWKSPLRSIWNECRNIKRKILGPSLQLKEQTSRAYAKGFSFHQREVAKDPILLEWVLRKDYWDYKLPNGWMRYLQN